ncbi:MAG: GEVED domain-containing protein [Bacteroidetes bacterium]|nr:GEVED domain-containing protein [Bacteroidota bacterium]
MPPTIIDYENNGQPNANATGDDNNGTPNDDKGLIIPPLYLGVQATFYVYTSPPGKYLQAWIDWDGMGWGAGDQVATDIVQSSSPYVFNVLIPPTASIGYTFARFRYSSTPGLLAGGQASDGEVEDYQVFIDFLDDPHLPKAEWGDAPASYHTLKVDNGATHAISPFKFGAGKSYEWDGKPDVSAAFDNCDDGNVVFDLRQSGSIIKGQVTFDLPLFPGFLQVWVDFDHDGDWSDPYDQVIKNFFYIGPPMPNLTKLFTGPCNGYTGPTYARLRYSTLRNLISEGFAPNGEVEDFLVTIIPESTVLDMADWGDAPAPFPTRSVDNGPYHVGGDIVLGSVKDFEPNGNPNPEALGDDLTGQADEDGVILLNPPMVPGQIAAFEIRTNTPGSYLSGWIDFTGDKDWSTPGDQIFTSFQLTLTVNYLNVMVPQTALPGNTFARFRLSAQSGSTFTGGEDNGEVEDYEYWIRPPINTTEYDFGDAPDPGYPTLTASNGARHDISTLHLGNFIDYETEGMQDSLALGDNNNGMNDEDGIIFLQPCYGKLINIQVSVSDTAGYLQGWVDFNKDADWSDSLEQVFKDIKITSNPQLLSFEVPENGSVWNTYARFRYSSSLSLSDTGYAADGEVEDYLIQLDTTLHNISTFNITPAGNFCVIDSVNITLQGSETGIEYQLYVDGEPAGNPGQGDGTPISFGVQTIPGSYMIYGSNGCGVMAMSDQPVVIIHPLPPVIWDNPLENQCSGSTSYALTGATPAGGTYSGPGVTGSDFNASLAGLGSHTITYTYTDPVTGCMNYAENTIEVFYNPLIFNVSEGAAVCASSSYNFNVCLDGSQPSVLYELYLNNNLTPYSLQGNGGSICFPNIVQPGIYTVKGTDNITGLWSWMNGNAVFMIYPDPFAVITGSTTICQGGNAYLTINFTNATPPYSLEIYNGYSTQVYDNIISNPYVITVSPSQTTTYTLIWVADFYCFNNQLGSTAIVEVSSQADIRITIGDTLSCCGSPDTLTASSNLQLNYIWSTGFAGNPLIVSSTVIGATTYTVTGTNSQGCTGTKSITIYTNYCDWGDAPDSYQTTLSVNGPRHYFSAKNIGNAIDYEPNGQPGMFALSDDYNYTATGACYRHDGYPCLNDEKGITFQTIPSTAGILTFYASFDLLQTGWYLQAWIDLDRSGYFSNNEQVITNFQITTDITSFSIPVTSGVDYTYMRFRYSSVLDLPFYGFAPDGEVEDYYLDPSIPVTGTTGVTGNVGYGEFDNPVPIINTPIILYSFPAPVYIFETVTDIFGHFAFDNICPGTYTLEVDCQKPWGGGNGNDALLIMRNFAHLTQLTGIYLKAADVNGSGLANGADALAVARRFAGSSNSFPVGNWVFDKPEIIVPENGNANVEVRGLCYGDVNGSYNPIAKTCPSVSLETDGMLSVHTQDFEIPIKVNSPLEIGAISMVVEIPGECLSINKVTVPGEGSLVFNQTGNELRIVWFSLKPLILNAGDILLTLTCTLNSESVNDLSCNWILGNESSLGDANARQHENVKLTYPKLVKEGSSFYLGQNEPNPFTGITEIPCCLPEAGRVSLKVYDMMGNHVMTLVDQWKEAGSYRFALDGNRLPAGVYNYQIECKGEKLYFNKARRLIIER